jgi:signal transduction histidine kinase
MTFAKRLILLGAAIPFLAAAAYAGERGTKPEAIAMVKKAVAAISANGADKTYADINAKDAKYHERDLYVVVYDSTGKCLAHGNNTKLVGKDLIDAQDADGVYYVKDRVGLMKTKSSFWQDYKFSDPLTKKIEPKSTYCEKLNNTAVCVGVYK